MDHDRGRRFRITAPTAAAGGSAGVEMLERFLE
jgi:hypothetical protein